MRARERVAYPEQLRGLFGREGTADEAQQEDHILIGRHSRGRSVTVLARGKRDDVGGEAERWQLRRIRVVAGANRTPNNQ
jgi:hypothetical protein